MTSSKKAQAVLFAVGFFALILVGGEYTPPPPECSDGIDNNGDGFADANAVECYYTPAPAPGDTEPPVMQYCPNHADENHPPMNQDQCNGN